MRIVIALGGNALLKRGEAPTVEVQRRNAHIAAQAIAQVAQGNELILTHGNGPQIGLLALQAASGKSAAPFPLDVLGAETDGMIGYLLEQELINARGDRHVATLLTQVEVDAADPAFRQPTKFIGPQYDAAESQGIAAANGWTMALDGTRWRRVVPSPQPRQILEIEAIRLLVAGGFITLCAGGGGIPVARTDGGAYRGIECVVDKDLTSALLAEQLDADCLVMLTDVPAVLTGFGTPYASQIRHATPGELDPSLFPAGSMGPKVEAACRFAQVAGRRACIGNLAEVGAILEGRAGTTVTAAGKPIS
jgi:carbamate kinase